VQTRLSALPPDVREPLERVHVDMCRALSAEMCAQKRPPVELPEGTRLQEASGAFEAIYRFPVARPRTVEEGEPVTLVLPSAPGRQQLGCGAVALRGRSGELLLSTRLDFGPSIAQGGSLIPREGLPLHVVQELLDSVRAGDHDFQPDIALRLLGEHDRARRLFRAPRQPWPMCARRSPVSGPGTGRASPTSLSRRQSGAWLTALSLPLWVLLGQARRLPS
jgi:hypothetical protein